MKGKTGHDVHEVVRNVEVGKEVIFITRTRGKVLMQRYVSEIEIKSFTHALYLYVVHCNSVLYLRRDKRRIHENLHKL